MNTLRVLDLSQDVAGAYAGMMLAELGTDVIKLEPPGTGDPWRSRSNETPTGLTFAFMNRRKHSITLDIGHAKGRQLLLALVKHLDAVIESFPPKYLTRQRLSFRTLRRANPQLVLTSLAPFGQDGPRKGWEATELVLQATGGTLAETGFADAAPARLPGFQASCIAGLNAACATLAAVYDVKAHGGKGVHLDLSMQEAFLPHAARHISQYAYTGAAYFRESRVPGAAKPMPTLNSDPYLPNTVEALDGEIYLLANRSNWERFASFIGLNEFIDDAWSDPKVRHAHHSEIGTALREAISQRRKYEWFKEASAHDMTWGPVDNMRDILASPQLEARGFFQPAQVDGHEIPCPSLPFSFAAQPRMPNRAPRLGEHNSEVFDALLGLHERQLTALRKAGVV